MQGQYYQVKTALERYGIRNKTFLAFKDVPGNPHLKITFKLCNFAAFFGPLGAPLPLPEHEAVPCSRDWRGARWKWEKVASFLRPPERWLEFTQKFVRLWAPTYTLPPLLLPPWDGSCKVPTSRLSSHSFSKVRFDSLKLYLEFYMYHSRPAPKLMQKRPPSLSTVFFQWKWT